MPNKTFFNLPKERQEEIIRVSIEEFANHDFDSASLNRIINTLEIAKGSFYRYFTSKTDLYTFLINYTLDIQLKYITAFDPGQDLLDGLTISKKLVLHVLLFEFIHYDYANFLCSIPKSEQFQSYLSIKQKEYTKIIYVLQDKKLIRNDIDKDIIIFCIFKNMTLIRDFIIDKLNIPENEFSKGYAIYKKYEKSINEIVNKYCDLLFNGLKYK